MINLRSIITSKREPSKRALWLNTITNKLMWFSNKGWEEVNYTDFDKVDLSNNRSLRDSFLSITKGNSLYRTDGSTIPLADSTGKSVVTLDAKGKLPEGWMPDTYIKALNDIKAVSGEVDQLKEEVAGIKAVISGIDGIKEDITLLKEQVKALQDEVSSLKGGTTA